MRGWFGRSSRLSGAAMAAVAGFLLAALHGGAGWAQTSVTTPAAVARGAPVFNRLGCAACHGGLGADAGNAVDLARSTLPRLPDAEETLYRYMTNTPGHPDNRQAGNAGRAIAPVSPAEAAAIVGEVRVQWEQVRAQRGREEAPGVLAAAGVACDLTGALYMPITGDRKSKTRTEAYEVACKGALGRVVIRTMAAGKASFEVRDCITTSIPAADGKPNLLACALPANAVTPEALAPYLAEAGTTCDLKQTRALGAAGDVAYFEAACAGGRGYVVGAPIRDAAKGVTAVNCLALEPGGSTDCRLIPREAMLASATDGLVAAADKDCAVRGRRYVAASQGDTYYEIACASGVGFIVASDARGGLKTKVACANADGIAGGCTLTDSRAAQTGDNARYAGLAKAAGYDCAVTGYRTLAATAQDETVEMACANRGDGAVAQFPRAGAARIFNCAAAETTGFACVLTKPEAAHAQLTAALKARFPTTTCQVSESRFLGVTPEAGFVEVACTDRAPGYVLQYAKTGSKPAEALYCSRLKAQLGSVTCGLPGNLPK